MNLKEIEEIIHLLEKNGITEFNLEKNDFKISLKRGLAGYQATVIPAQPFIPQGSLTLAQDIMPSSPAQDSNVTEVVTPMVGTFYAAPNKDSEPYVKAGDKIKLGDVLCIIEAMKVMNEIKAEVSGTLVEVLVENGQPLEFGQPLFKIKP